jgi:hypothetical protein
MTLFEGRWTTFAIDALAIFSVLDVIIIFSVHIRRRPLPLPPRRT